MDYEFPHDFLPTVAGYLPPLDAIHLNCTCKKAHTHLSLTVTSPRRILAHFFRQNPDDDAHYGFQVPVPPPVRAAACHSMILSLTWRDQGYGDRRGRVYLTAENRFHPGSGGRVVYVSDAAPHAAQRLNIEFQPRGHETYHLSYVVGGGGGGCDLHLSDVTVQCLVHDTRTRCFGNAHRFLTRSDVLPPWDEPPPRRNLLPVDVEEMYLAGGTLVPPLISFAHDGNQTIARASGTSGVQRELSEFMELMGTLRSLYDAWVEECATYAKSNAVEAQLPSEPSGAFKGWDHRDVKICSFRHDIAMMEDTDSFLTDDDDTFMFDFESEEILGLDLAHPEGASDDLFA